MKKRFCLLLCVVLCLSSALLGLCSCKRENPDRYVYVKISVRDFGDMTARLDKEAAPLTVDNFVKLVNEKFYDGLTFHRIIDGFMIQGGDPRGDGTGNSKERIIGEFDSNGHKNPLRHVRGTLSMARSGGDKNSASCQFFICQTTCATLDGDYAAFGMVTEGISVVDKIINYVNTTEPAREPNSQTILDRSLQPVIESIRLIEPES